MTVYKLIRKLIQFKDFRCNGLTFRTRQPAQGAGQAHTEAGVARSFANDSSLSSGATFRTGRGRSG
jgi:hypothetical protein